MRILLACAAILNTLCGPDAHDKVKVRTELLDIQDSIKSWKISEEDFKEQQGEIILQEFEAGKMLGKRKRPALSAAK